MLAINLWAAVAANREESGFANMPADQRLVDARMAEARGRLDPETVAAAWADGRAMSVDAAIEAAMGLVRAPAETAGCTPADATNGGAGVIGRPCSTLSGASRPNRRMVSMHRSRMVTLLGGALLAAFLLIFVALAGAPTAATGSLSRPRPRPISRCAAPG